MECSAIAVQVPLPAEPRAPCHVVKRLAERPQVEKEEALRRRQDRLQQQLDRLAAHNAKIQRARNSRRRRCSAMQCCVGEKQRLAEERRQQLRNAEAERLSRHHSNVIRARSRNREAECEKVLSAMNKLRLAAERRQQMRDVEAERLSRHHSNVASALSRNLFPATDKVQSVLQKQQLAEERRQQLREAEAQRLARLHLNVSRAQCRNRETVAAEKDRVQKTILGYKQHGLGETAAFDELQRQITNKDTMRATQDLLRLVLSRLAKVESEEKEPIGEDTPAVASPPRFSRPPAAEHPSELAASARQFLSAYIMASDNDERDEGLGDAMSEAARALLSRFAQLLKLLETDAAAAGRETRRALRDFGRLWSTYKAAFAAWKRADKGNLIEHYINVYGDVQRGRESAILAHSPGRREGNHQLLVAAIDNELTQLRGQIAKLGGDGALAELERRLQLVGAVSPTSTPAPTPPGTPEATSLGAPASTAQRPAPEGLEAGAVVQAQGLQQQPQLNGQRGTITGRQGDRWGVRFDDNSLGVKALRGENLSLVREASPGPPAPSTPPRPSDALLRAQLAHEAAMSPIAGLTKKTEVPAEKRLVAAVGEQMERALWDLIGEGLAEQPPSVERIGAVLQMMRETLLELAPRRHREELGKEMDERLDWETMRRSTHSFEELGHAVAYHWGKLAEYGAPADEAATVRRGTAALDRIRSGGSPGEVVPRELKEVLRALRELRDRCVEERAKLAGPVLRREATETIRRWLKTEKDATGMPVSVEWIRAVRERVLATPGEYHLQLPREAVEGLTCAAVFEALPRAGVVDAVCAPQSVEPLPEMLVLSRSTLADLAGSVQRLVMAASAAMLCSTHVHMSCAKQGKPGAAMQVRNRVATAVNEVLLQAQAGQPLSIAQVATRAVAAADEALVAQGLSPLREDQQRLLAGGGEGEGAIQRMVRLSDEGAMLDRTMAISLRRLRALLTEQVFGTKPVEIAEGSPFAPLRKEAEEVCAAVDSVATLVAKWVRPCTDAMLQAP